jgi:hypothetical protein
MTVATGVVEIRFLAPGKVLSINESAAHNWAARRRWLEPWRDAVGWAWKMLPVDERTKVVNVPCIVRVTIGFRTAQSRDPHNYVGTVCKALVDQLVDQGVWPNDTPKWVSVAEPICVKGEFVIVELIPREE